ncbi:MAG: peptide chain release factor N(5)-glutamine methyltransferase, partial [Candidatus Cloacimonetes bacterium]|nr:peptide chain release factor N(5)-glutamine methyltransferase [Candidatus Cloacimonadota bacterium]
FVDFYGCKIAVNENVLIPRSETEFMVDLIIKDMPSQAEHILDICTGSGAIAIALQKARPLITVAACDIYEKALQVAKANAEKNSVKIDLILSNLFQNIGQQKFDLIVSNPPYVSQDEYKSLQPEIYFEPEKALVAEAEGLFCINKIITEAKDWLKPDGYLYLEIGEKQAESIKKIVNKLPVAEFIVYKDLSDRDRIIRIKFNG